MYVARTGVDVATFNSTEEIGRYEIFEVRLSRSPSVSHFAARYIYRDFVLMRLATNSWNTPAKEIVGSK